MHVTGIENATPNALAQQPAERILRTLRLPQHARLTQVELLDGTDQHNGLVHEREWLLHPNESLALRGNLFVVAEVHSCHETLIVKMLALPHARPVPSPADVRVTARPDGFDLHIVTGDPDETCETLHVMTHDGGALERARVLQQLQRALRPQTPAHQIPRAQSNTWGDRNRDACICDAFVRQEIAAAARLGLDVVQLDDGWQKGTTANSINAQTHNGIWDDYWANDPDFWTPHPQRFPNGFAPLVELARAHNLTLGIWYSPDSSGDFKNFQRDADTLLALHRAHGVCHFKLDGIKIRSAAGRKNFDAFVAALLDGSRGAIVFDLDVTAEIRPGYFGAISAGVLFVENRYTDWHRYWPHHTLRNLWQLSRWIDPRRLRMEVLNPSRNAHLYAGDPLAPACYPPETVLATVLFCNPLFFCEVSNLPPACSDAWRELLKVWRARREEIFNATLLPVGDAPDGVAWTGFLAHSPDVSHLLLFRELNSSPAFTFAVDTARVERLAGHGEVAVDARGITVTLPQTLSFIWLRFFPARAATP